MALPDSGPATLDPVKRFLQIASEDHTDDDELTDTIAAVNAKVRGLRSASVAEGLDDWDDPSCAAVVRGSILLSARLFRRRNTPDGVSALAGDFPVFVQRTDPDVAMLLGLGNYAKPGVG